MEEVTLLCQVPQEVQMCLRAMKARTKDTFCMAGTKLQQTSLGQIYGP